MKSTFYTSAIIFGVFVLLFTFERFVPLRQSKCGLIGRLIVNGALSAVTFLVAAIIVRPSALRTLDWSWTSPFGLLHLVPLPGGVQFAAGFLLLDLSFYYWHIANHKIPWLWRFHNVHHMDPDLDVSTGFRFHFGEVLLSAIFRVIQISAIGISLASFVAYELVFQANTLFHHSNVRLPIRLERLLNRVLVTPRMHGIHHSRVRRETNSNFGVVFCCWDKFHRTLGLNIPQSKIKIGVAGYALPDDNSLATTFILPFIKQRDYWRGNDGSSPQRNAEDLQGPPHQLSE
ncbi:MAG TPA: sterol desaturase family protein [Patescibacteria group bacterium]|nr:sterol desaturase family protein [Patescibacteria group bacterium]